jgi:hypothetical protein
MPIFDYNAIDGEYEVEGSVTATDEEEARRKISQMGYTLKKLTAVPESELVNGLGVLVGWVLWTPIGFLYAIPLILFATARFAISIVWVALARADASRIGPDYVRALDFYFEGFRRISKALLSKTRRHRDNEVDWGKVALQSVLTGVFWIIVVLSISAWLLIPRGTER